MREEQPASGVKWTGRQATQFNEGGAKKLISHSVYQEDATIAEHHDHVMLRRQQLLKHCLNFVERKLIVNGKFQYDNLPLQTSMCLSCANVLNINLYEIFIFLYPSWAECL